MKILATDLDRTLLPNGSWEADPEAIGLFNTLTEQQDVLVVYVTGRNLALTEKAIQQYGVRHPDVLCGDVGTSIRKYANGEWQFDDGWISHVRDASPRWDAAAIRDAVSDIDGMREQEKEHLNPFKQSYYVEHDRSDAVLKQVDEQVKGRFDEVIIYSFDSQDGKGLLDFLPASATKLTALEYVAGEFGATKQDVVFCGDSGNDIFPLTAGFCGVLVRNADDQLVANVNRALDENPDLKIYFAKGGFRGLQGYYTSGVIEGAYHYGLFDDALPE
ncbi:MAG TPA: HAD-IIB family hydrolase [Gammaproteobacteria bacterium]|nr:HAD-IIB family hydrolase [Gammaproteobacteria bacterium]